MDLMCRSGAFRVRAADPDEADKEIRRREEAWATAGPDAKPVRLPGSAITSPAARLS